MTQGTGAISPGRNELRVQTNRDEKTNAQRVRGRGHRSPKDRCAGCGLTGQARIGPEDSSRTHCRTTPLAQALCHIKSVLSATGSGMGMRRLLSLMKVLVMWASQPAADPTKQPCSGVRDVCYTPAQGGISRQMCRMLAKQLARNDFSGTQKLRTCRSRPHAYSVYRVNEDLQPTCHGFCKQNSLNVPRLVCLRRAGRSR